MTPHSHEPRSSRWFIYVMGSGVFVGILYYCLRRFLELSVGASLAVSIPLGLLGKMWILRPGFGTTLADRHRHHGAVDDTAASGFGMRASVQPAFQATVAARRVPPRRLDSYELRVFISCSATLPAGHEWLIAGLSPRHVCGWRNVSAPLCRVPDSRRPSNTCATVSPAG
jgi:hypothetical protein